MRDYLTKNPEILVEMTTELDKRQAVRAGRAAAKGDLRECRRDLPFAGLPYRRQSRRRCERGRVLRLQLRLLPPRAARRRQARERRRQDPSRAEGPADLRRGIRGCGQERRSPPTSRANISRCIRSCSPSPARPTRRRRLRIAKELGLDVDKLQKDMPRTRHEEGAGGGQGPCPETQPARHAALPYWRLGRARRARRPLR